MRRHQVFINRSINRHVIDLIIGEYENVVSHLGNNQYVFGHIITSLSVLEFYRMYDKLVSNRSIYRHIVVFL